MKIEYIETERPKRKRRRVKVGRLISSSIIVILLFELIRLAVGVYNTKPVVVAWGSITKGCWVEALFLRNETLLISPDSGNMVNTIASGIRVPKGEIIGYLNNNPAISNPELSLGLFNKYHAFKNEETALLEDLKRVSQEIANKSRKYHEISSHPELSATCKEDLSSLEQEKAQIIRSIETTRHNLKKIKEKLNLEVGELTLVRAGEPGYLYFQYDGWEGRLTPADFEALSEAEFRQSYPLNNCGSKVKADAVVGKIISPFKQIIAVIINPKITGEPELGKGWWVKTPQGVYNVIVKNKIALSDHKMILALEDEGLGNNYMPGRRARLFLIYKRVSGLLVPNSAIYHHDQQTVVRLAKKDGYQELPVQVLETDGAQAVIEGIAFGTTILSR